jgi:hypothetical protein
MELWATLQGCQQQKACINIAWMNQHQTHSCIAAFSMLLTLMQRMLAVLI